MPNNPSHLPIPASRPQAPKARFADIEAAVNELYALFQDNRLDPRFRKDFPKIQEIMDKFNEGNFAEVPGLIGALDSKYADIVERITRLETEVERTHRGVTQAHHRIARLEDRVAAVEQLGIDPNILRGALAAGAKRGETGFIAYARSHGVMDGDLQIIFDVFDIPEEGFDDNEAIRLLLKSHLNLKGTVEEHTIEIESINDQVTTLKQQNSVLYENDVKIANRLESVEKTQTANSSPAWPLVVGGIVALVMAWIVGANSTRSNWWALAVGLGIGAIVAGVCYALARQITKSKVVTSSSEAYRRQRTKSQSKKTPAEAEGSDTSTGTPPNGTSESPDVPQPEPAHASS